MGFDPISLGVSAAIMGVTALIGRAKRRGAQRIGATEIANHYERLMKDNLRAFEASPATAANKEAALFNFDSFWAEFEEQCGNPQLGVAGQNCISERKPGAGMAFDWWGWYRTPIEGAPLVAGDGALVQPSVGGTAPSFKIPSLLPQLQLGSVSGLQLALLATLAVGGTLLLMSGGGRA